MGLPEGPPGLVVDRICAREPVVDQTAIQIQTRGRPDASVGPATSDCPAGAAGSPAFF